MCSQRLGVVEDTETRQFGVGVWSRDGQLQHFWNEALGATWVTEHRLLLATPQDGMVYELVDSESGAAIDRLSVDGPKSVAGMVLSTAADARHCGVEMFSGQSEVGYSVLRVEGRLRRIVNLEYVSGESNLEGIAFSHGGQLAAWAVRLWGIWWCPEDLDAEDDTPSRGGVVDWAWLYLANLESGSVERVTVAASLPEGWIPKASWSDAGPPQALTFTREGRIRMVVPWFGTVELDIGATERLLVPGPKL